MHTLARLYDMQHDPALRDAMTYVSPTTGDRVGLFRLAWDTCCSAFASRQVLYERFFQGDRLRHVILLHELYDKEPMTNWVREFLEDA